MCQICDKAKTLPPKKGLELIATELKKGRKAEHFKRVMDSMLGTDEPESDPALDAAWERGHRQQPDE